MLPERNGCIVIRVIFFFFFASPCAGDRAALKCTSLGPKRQQRKSSSRMREFPLAETWWLWRLQRRSRSHYFQFIRGKRRKVMAECNLCATPKAPQWEITQKINTNWGLLLPIVPWANSCTCYVDFFVAFRSRLQCPCAKAQRPLLDVQQPAMNYISAFFGGIFGKPSHTSVFILVKITER